MTQELFIDIEVVVYINNKMTKRLPISKKERQKFSLIFYFLIIDNLINIFINNKIKEKIINDITLQYKQSQKIVN